jgi:hypothetical protein
MILDFMFTDGNKKPQLKLAAVIEKLSVEVSDTTMLHSIT